MSVDRPNVLWIKTNDIDSHLGCYADVWPATEVAHTPPGPPRGGGHALRPRLRNDARDELRGVSR